MTLTLASLDIFKYPRTAHVEGSRLQEGDSSHDQRKLSTMEGQYAVIEEKLDGANTGISFTPDGELLLQSRGHYLTGGVGDKKQFRPFVQWANAHETALYTLLGDRYVMYGEWAYSKHSIFYDVLPHYFHEFDIYDKIEGTFLSTQSRRGMIGSLPFLSVPVLYEGDMPTQVKLLRKLVRPSLAKTERWKHALESTVVKERQELDMVQKQTDGSNSGEGLYIKIENEHHVLGRYKFVRSDFTQTILDSGSHHEQRPLLANGLHPLADLYSDSLSVRWENLGLSTIRGLDQLIAWQPPSLDAEWKTRGVSYE